MTDPFDSVPISRAALDKAWRRYNHGACSFGAAVADMVAAGLTYPEAQGAVDAPHMPSAGILAVTG